MLKRQSCASGECWYRGLSLLISSTCRRNAQGNQIPITLTPRKSPRNVRCIKFPASINVTVRRQRADFCSFHTMRASGIAVFLLCQAFMSDHQHSLKPMLGYLPTRNRLTGTVYTLVLFERVKVKPTISKLNMRVFFVLDKLWSLRVNA